MSFGVSWAHASCCWFFFHHFSERAIGFAQEWNKREKKLNKTWAAKKNRALCATAKYNYYYYYYLSVYILFGVYYYFCGARNSVFCYDFELHEDGNRTLYVYFVIGFHFSYRQIYRIADMYVKRSSQVPLAFSGTKQHTLGRLSHIRSRQTAKCMASNTLSDSRKQKLKCHFDLFENCTYLHAGVVGVAKAEGKKCLFTFDERRFETAKWKRTIFKCVNGTRN